MELLPNSMFSLDCEELFHKVQVTLGFEPCLWLKERPNAYYTWNGHLKGELGRHKALVISVCSLCSERPQMFTHFCCRHPWQCSGPPKNVVLLMTQASPDTGLSQRGSDSFACVCVKEGVIILLA